ncbi:MAG TPA: glycerol-3-phosphate dehydrogenase [Blastocatellia bacterium]|jgi:glycerol-3-phosphate dehydrogenase|nr:glycerol-3-phosphate dehydrogenase [Blastocatellia bacterium]
MCEGPKTESGGAGRLSASARAANLKRIEREEFDLAVIGGGITGAGIALDAASRGMTAALVEKRDFASGTSSRSSKLIHGGLRYLEQFEFSLVREALRERATLARSAPHLSKPLAFLAPVYSEGVRSPLGNNRLKLRAGLSLYDLLAGRKNIARHRWLTREGALRLAPALESKNLRGGFVYYDCLTDDARLVIEVVKAASQCGAVVANYAQARGFTRTGGRITGAEVEDRLNGGKVELRAKVFVNATGVWSDEVSRLADAGAGRRLRPSKGIHVVMPSEKFGAQSAVLIPSLGEQRFLFVIPWQGRTVIGTTDTDYAGDLDEPRAEAEEIKRVVESAARYFPGAAISTDDVISSYAGLRPLVCGIDKSTKELSRKEEIFESEPGLISIIGGKLTTYRRMGERVVDLVAQRLGRGKSTGRARAGTGAGERVPLAGGLSLSQNMNEEAARAADEFGVAVATARHLIETYGGNYKKLLEITRESEDLKQALARDLPHIGAEVVYAARYEMAVTIDDFLARRTRIALIAGDGGRSCAMRVASLMGRELGWSNAEAQKAMAGFPA